jgi:Tol biopolymer transport system component/DNA-binding winged helix-turn-helix (wHTH) protein
MSEESSLREHFKDGLWIGEWFVEPMRNRFWLGEEETQVEPKVMEVLLCMAKRPGETVTKEKFKDVVWRDTVVTDDVLSRCISQLRKMFDDDPKDPSYIETIRKTGYRLVASVEPPSSTETVTSSTGDTALSTAHEESESPLQRLLSEITGRLRASSPDTADQWIVVAGGSIQRRWMLGIAGLFGLLLAVGLVLWVTPPLFVESNEPPLSAQPFTTFAGEEFDPALSPVGQQVAFAWRKPDRQTQSIYVLQRGAEQPLQLSPDSTFDWSPTWSPDGRFVAYAQTSDGTDRISVVPSIGGQASRALSFRRRDLQGIAWMPEADRRTLVVAAQRRPHRASGLSLQFPDLDSTVTLTRPPLWSTGDTDPAPSPDGSQIAFVRGSVPGVEDLFVVPASGGPPRQITNDSTAINGIAWSADGTDLLYAAERSGLSGIWRVSAEGGSPTLVRSASEGTQFRHPTLSPEADRLAYTQRSAQLDVWALRQPTQYEEFSAAPLIASTQQDRAPSIAPEGDHVAFVSTRSGSSEVWLAQADGSAPSQLTSLDELSVETARWSPTGTRLCFVGRQHGQSDLYVIPASGGSPTRLTRSSSEDLVPRWSSEGRWVYFSSNRSEEWEAWRTLASPDSHRVQQVTSGGAVSAQDSRTDSTLYYVRPDTLGIWTVSLDPDRFPLHVRSDSATLPVNVVRQFDPRDRRHWWVGESGIHFMYRRSTEATLAYFDFSSSRVLPLYQFPHRTLVQDIATGPGGEWFAYTHVDRQNSDVMLLENFR